MIFAILRFIWAATLCFYWSVQCATRTWLYGPRRSWTYCRIRWGKGVMNAIKVGWNIQNAERLTGPSIFVCNHQSFLDVVLLPAIIPPETVIVAKQEVKKVPILGPAFAAAGAVLVDRSNPRGAISGMRAAVAELPSHWSVILWPEGTRSVTGELKHFKKGCIHLALATHYPIVPIAVHGVRELTARWPRGLPRPGTVEIAVGEPIATDGWTHESTDHQLAQVRAAVAQELSRARAAWAANANMESRNVSTSVSPLENSWRPE
ncbi:MAG: 1-acyl-sn-glycerol-3-phosphate acyltransferase [Clostridia bacterium]|nr:1-acyl-sn-glycerol-3-phosphate acyltransferase [Deltaproteobacteria bacterium]